VHEKHFVLGLMLVPDKLTKQLHEAYLLPVELTGDMRVPMCSDSGKCAAKIDFVHGEIRPNV
jgi:hypothetical protein